MIEVHDLHFTYPDGRFAVSLDRMTADVGSSLAITGPSGSGKTTLLHLIAGLLPAVRGRLEVCGHDIVGLGDGARRAFRKSHIGLVFQNARLIDYLSVRDNILVGEHCEGLVRRMDQAATRCRSLAENLGLSHLLEQRSDQISQGEAQRVAIARALLSRPRVVLADEPTASLDADSAERAIQGLVKASKEQGATLIVASHDERCIAACERRLDIAGLASRSASS